jgi:hypothetical protein
MGIKHPNHRLLKKHRNYTVEEIASTLGFHPNSVRAWLRNDLPAIADSRPKLILGSDAIDYLRARRQRGKRPCAAGEIYCMKCREPRRPSDRMAVYSARTETRGVLIGMCPECRGRVFRCVNLAKLDLIRGDLDITMAEGERHIATAVIAEAAKVCFPNWHLKSDVRSDLFLGITTVLVQQFKGANLHMPATGFAERAMRLLEKTRFSGKFNEDSTP